MYTKPASDEHEAFYAECVQAFKVACANHRGIRTIEVLAILGRMAGYTLAACHRHERDLARGMLLENVDQACREVAQAGTDTAGHA